MTGPKRPEHAVSIDVDVSFHHCDPLGVVWHGRYYEFFEVARQALLASVGLDVPTIRALGFRMYVTESRCRHMAPLTFGDTARVTAWVSRATPLIRIAYDVKNLEDDRWAARAATVLATTDAEGTLLPCTPDEIARRLPAVHDET